MARTEQVMEAGGTQTKERRKRKSAGSGETQPRKKAPRLKPQPSPVRATAHVPPQRVARVDLMPPIVEVRRKQRARIRLLLIGLAGLALISVAAAFAVSFLANAAEAAQTEAEQRRVQLVEEQAGYAELSTVKSQLLDHQTAEIAALFAETDWSRVMTQLEGSLPAGISLSAEQITIIGAAAGAAAVESTQLDAPGVIEIRFTAQSDQFILTTPLLNGLQSLTGYVSATVSDVTGSPDEGYTVSGVVQLGVDALGGTARVAALDPDVLAALYAELEALTVPQPEATAPPEGSGATDAGSTEDTDG